MKRIFTLKKILNREEGFETISHETIRLILKKGRKPWIEVNVVHSCN